MCVGWRGTESACEPVRVCVSKCVCRVEGGGVLVCVRASVCLCARARVCRRAYAHIYFVFLLLSMSCRPVIVLRGATGNVIYGDVCANTHTHTLLVRTTTDIDIHSNIHTRTYARAHKHTHTFKLVRAKT